MSGRTLGGRRERHLIAAVSTPRLDAASDPTTIALALDDLATQGNELAERARVHVVDVALVVGANTITHPLGRAPRAVSITPHTATATFGAGWDPAQPTNKHPDLQSVVTVVGAPARCRITLA